MGNFEILVLVLEHLTVASWASMNMGTLEGLTVRSLVVCRPLGPYLAL